MARTRPFDQYRDRYEEWFVFHRFVYESERAAIRAVCERTWNQ